MTYLFKFVELFERKMKNITDTHRILVKDKLSVIDRKLLDELDIDARFIAIKGSRGVGKTTFLLDYIRENYLNDPSVLYVNMNNLFFTTTGLLPFIDKFYKRGGKILLLDQIHKYSEWEREIRQAYISYPDLKIIFSTSSIVNIQNNFNLKEIVKKYNLNGFSFREFLHVQTEIEFRAYSLEEILKYHNRIVDEILLKVRPLAYFSDYLKYGYFPVFTEHRSHIDNLLKNINLTLEFDIPYLKQIELKYLPKLKQLLYILASQAPCQPNVSKLSSAIGVSRATIMNYLYYLREARLLNLLVEQGQEPESGKKPNEVYLHNTNLMYAISTEGVDESVLAKTFFLNQVSNIYEVNYSSDVDFLVDEQHRFIIGKEHKKKNIEGNYYIAEDMIEKGEGNTIPLWLFGFLY